LEVASAMEFMSARFGAPPSRTLTVSPIPGGFGQGFPGLLYLSTLSYLSPEDRPVQVRSPSQHRFFSELLYAHETAHQWWGNVVTSASYQDEWLMEALANYSALLFLEKRKGRKAMEQVLEEYKTRLLAKTETGRTVESTGPIVWGTRLNSSQAPGAWRTITYEKGSWILHMLRAHLGDEKFRALLTELVRRYRYQPLTTEQFRQLATEFAAVKPQSRKLDGFFDQWIYGTGIPTLRFKHTVQGKAPAVKLRGSMEQRGVEEDFSVEVPVEVQMPGKRTLTHWVRTGSEPVTFTIDLRQAPVKVAMDPGSTLLAVRE